MISLLLAAGGGDSKGISYVSVKLESHNRTHFKPQTVHLCFCWNFAFGGSRLCSILISPGRLYDFLTPSTVFKPCKNTTHFRLKVLLHFLNCTNRSFDDERVVSKR